MDECIYGVRCTLTGKWWGAAGWGPVKTARFGLLEAAENIAQDLNDPWAIVRVIPKVIGVVKTRGRRSETYVEGSRTNGATRGED